MKIISFHDGLNAIRKQLRELNRKIEKSDEKALKKTISKKEFLNSVIMESLNESEREKEQILNSIVEQVCYIDLDYRIKWINNAGLKPVSSSASIEDVYSKTCYEIWFRQKKPCENCPVATTLKTGWPWKEELVRPDGRTMLVSSQPVVDDNGKTSGLIIIELDITMRKDIEKALERSRKRAQALLDVIPDFLLVFDKEGILLDYHPAADFNILTDNKSPEGKHLGRILPQGLAADILKYAETTERQGQSRSFEYMLSAESENTFFECNLMKTTETEHVCIVRDITARKIREREILKRSFHDKLTGLYNRAYFEEELSRIEQSREALPTSILVIDVNSLKLTNDAFGHDYGDKLLQVVAEILSANCRKSDVIARTGGDEFSIILPGSPLAKARKLSERILKACRNRDFNDIFARPSVSIGCAEKSDNTMNLQDVIKYADEKMYKMKLKNRNENLNTLMKDILSSMMTHGFEKKRHIENCISLSEEFAFHLQLPSEDLEKLKNLALIHDIGNIRVSNEILAKPSSLSEKEITEIRQHSIIGYRIAKAIPNYSSIADLVLYHHEKWDGTGYPSGLKGKEIPLQCRIFTLIDSYDILTNGTEYRAAIPPEQALNELKNDIGKQFEPIFAEDFIEFIERKYG